MEFDRLPARSLRQESGARAVTVSSEPFSAIHLHRRFGSLEHRAHGTGMQLDRLLDAVLRAGFGPLRLIAAQWQIARPRGSTQHLRAFPGVLLRGTAGPVPL